MTTKGMFIAATIGAEAESRLRQVTTRNVIPIQTEIDPKGNLSVYIPNTMSTYTPSFRQILRDNGIKIIGDPTPPENL